MAESVRSKPVAAVAPSSPGKMSYDAFLAWADEDTRAEWVDGEVIRLGPASRRHQDLADFLTALLRHFVEAHELGVVLSAPFQMKLGPEGPGREPDVLFLTAEHLDRLKDNHLDGPADLAVEIVSPESRARDRGDKFYEYEQAGVREYWLIDPIRKQAEFYSLSENGIYTTAPLADGLFRSGVLPGLVLEVAWLWQDPLPRLVSVLKAWGLV